MAETLGDEPAPGRSSAVSETERCVLVSILSTLRARLYINEVAEKLGVSQATMYRTFKRLAECGVLSRAEDFRNGYLFNRDSITKLRQLGGGDLEVGIRFAIDTTEKASKEKVDEALDGGKRYYEREYPVDAAEMGYVTFFVKAREFASSIFQNDEKITGRHRKNDMKALAVCLMFAMRFGKSYRDTAKMFQEYETMLYLVGLKEAPTKQEFDRAVKKISPEQRTQMESFCSALSL
jgi:DNA-binding transcriptional ArsR family regulator